MNEIKRRFINISSIKWGVILVAIALVTPVFSYMDIKRFYDEGCVLDSLIVMSTNFVFPYLAMAFGMWIISAMEKDSNAMIVIKYKSKNALWKIQCIAIHKMAAMFAVIITVCGMVEAKVFFVKWCNWNQELCFLSNLYTKAGMKLNEMIPPVLSIICSVIIFYLMFAITGIWGIIVQNIGGTIAATLAIAVLGISDVMVNVSGIPFFYNILGIKILMFTQLQGFIKNIIGLTVIVLVSMVIGNFVAARREYL